MIVKTVLKNFNRDLLIEEITAALPLVSLQLSGFERISEFIGAPATEPKLVLRRRNPDGTYFEDFAQPGELRFDFSPDLTPAEDTILDGILSDHDSTGLTAEQTRRNQDTSDLDSLELNYPNYDAFNNTQRNNFLKTLARVVIRDARNSEF